MSTVFLNIVTQPYVSITNSIKINLYKTSDPLAVYASKTEAAPHPERTWSFPGLDRANYIVKIFEMNGSTVIQQLNSWTAVPSGSETTFREPEFIVVGATLGVEAGANSAVFDGADGKPDFRGWDIVIRQRGISGLRYDEYSWDKTTGEFSFLVEGKQFDATDEGGDTFEIEFLPSNEQTGGGVSDASNPFTDVIYVRQDYEVQPEDFLKKLLVKGNDAYLVIVLPQITTVVPNRLIYIESGKGNHKGLSIQSGNPNAIDWLTDTGRSEIYMGVFEDIAIYREQEKNEGGDATGENFWRVHSANGNFQHIGEEVGQYANLDMIFNKVRLDGGGTEGLLLEENMRLYYEYVDKLPPSRKVAYASWSTNKQKFSSLSGDGQRFRVPDVRGLYERTTTDGTDTPGDYKGQQLLSHGHTLSTTASGASGSATADPVRGGLVGSVNTRGGAAVTPTNDKSIGLTGSTENNPNSYITDKYILS